MDRGAVDEHYWADLAVLGPERVGSEASNEHPTIPPMRIRDVFVNGRPVLLAGHRTEQTPGVAVRQ
jgi:N-acyl-D-aspartate/D-glutamate deacylase